MSSRISFDEYVDLIKDNYLFLADVRSEQEKIAKSLREQLDNKYNSQVGLSAERFFRAYTNRCFDRDRYAIERSFDIENFNSMSDAFYSVERDIKLIGAINDAKVMVKDSIVKLFDVTISTYTPYMNSRPLSINDLPIGNQYWIRAENAIGYYEEDPHFYNVPFEKNPYCLGFKAAYKELYKQNSDDPRLTLIKRDGRKLDKSISFEEIEAEARKEKKQSESLIKRSGNASVSDTNKLPVSINKPASKNIRR